MEECYVVGHKNPDTDTVVAAIAMAYYLNNKASGVTFVPIMSGDPNSETSFVFEKFGVDLPKKVTNATDKKIYLVDHNEKSQMIEGVQMENVVGLVDHHKLQFAHSKPIYVLTLPWGSTNTIIYSMMKDESMNVSHELKSIMLCAMLSDTVILKSPTTTDEDRKFVKELALELDLDYQALGLEMFKAKAQVSKKTALEILRNDFKDFDCNGNKVGVGQLEAPDLSEVEPKLEELKQVMDELLEKEHYHSLVLMLTDIIQEGTKLLVVSKDMDTIATLFKTSFDNNLSSFQKGMMSRKKQVAPVLMGL